MAQKFEKSTSGSFTFVTEPSAVEFKDFPKSGRVSFQTFVGIYVLCCGYFRRFDTNPADVCTIVAKYIDYGSINSVEIRSNGSAMLLLLPSLLKIPLMFIRHFKLNFNHVGKGNFECGVIACLKDSGLTHVDYGDEFEKTINKALRAPKRKKNAYYGYGSSYNPPSKPNRFDKNVGSYFGEIRNKHSYARTAHFGWIPNGTESKFAFYNNDIEIISAKYTQHSDNDTDDNGNNVESDLQLKNGVNLFVKIEKLGSYDDATMKLWDEIKEQEEKIGKTFGIIVGGGGSGVSDEKVDGKKQGAAESSKIDSNEKVSSIDNDHDLEQLEQTDGLFYLSVSKYMDFSKVIGAGLMSNVDKKADDGDIDPNVVDTRKPDLIHSLDKHGRILLDFNRYYYYLGFRLGSNQRFELTIG